LDSALSFVRSIKIAHNVCVNATVACIFALDATCTRYKYPGRQSFNDLQVLFICLRLV